MKTTFIYALKEPDTGEIRYIGKADDPKERLYVHLADKSRNHRTNWIRSLDEKPDSEIVDEVPVEHWQQWEVAYIEFFREQGCGLVNGTPGGEGANLSLEAEERRCESIRKSWTDDRRAKMSLAMRSNKNALGSVCSEATRATLSLKNTGRVRSAESRAKMSLAQMGNKKCLGCVRSVETRASMSEAQILRRDRERQEKILAEMWK